MAEKKLFSKKKKDQPKKLFFNNSWEEISLIGEGSFGKVYEAKNLTSNNDLCAIKHIKIPQTRAEIQNLKGEGLSNEEIKEELQELVDKCLDEIKLMSQLKESANIVTIYDYEVIEDSNKIEWNINIRMELLTSIDEYFKDKKITNKDILKLAVDISNALVDCKKLKIIHRDIKPDNIFVSSDGTYKLGDFGIARNLERTTSGLSKKGTYNYMAPEVYKGKAYSLAVDIYSLGIVLYRFFNYNRIPFLPNYPTKIKYDDREESILKRMNGEKAPAPINANAKEESAILKAIEYDSHERYKTPEDMKEVFLNLYNSEEKRYLPLLNDSSNNIIDSNKTEKITSHTKDLDKTELIGQNSNDKTAAKEELDDLDNTEIISSFIKTEEKEATNEKIANLEKTEIIPVGTKKDKEKASNNKKVENLDKTEIIAESNKENVDKQESNNEKEEPKKNLKPQKFNVKKDKKKKLAILLLVALLFLSLCGFGIYKFIGNKNNIDKKYVNVPNLTGLSINKATKKLEELDLKEDIKYKEVDNKKQYGIVLKQNIKKKKVKVNSKIELTVGVSKQEIKVPNLVGKTKEEAEAELKNLGLKITVEEIENDTVEKGRVISQMQQEGQEVRKGTMIEVLVSKGKNTNQEEEKEETKENNQNNNTSSNTAPQIINPTSISISGGTRYLEKGTTAQFFATVLPANANNKNVVWSSSNNGVVSINQNGVVTGIGSIGTATITANVSGTGLFASTEVTVYRKGDANGDGVINSSDTTYILDCYKFKKCRDELSLKRADLDGNGFLDTADAASVYSYYDR